MDIFMKNRVFLFSLALIFLFFMVYSICFYNQDSITEVVIGINDTLSPPPISSIKISGDYVAYIQDEIPINNDLFKSIPIIEPPEEVVIVSSVKTKTEPTPSRQTQSPMISNPPKVSEKPVDPPKPSPPPESPKDGGENTLQPIVNTSSALYTYNNLIKDIGLLEERYGDLISSQTIGTSVLGYNIPAVRLGSSSAPKNILISGSLHAREYMTTQLIMKQIEYYLESYWALTYNDKKIEDILAHTAIYFVPMSNPDGVTLAQSGVSFIQDDAMKSQLLEMNGGKTNFSQWKSNIQGVDLNRNFDYQWSPEPLAPAGPEFYQGPTVESEPEVKVLADYMRQMKFDGYIDYHSKGNVIFWYTGQTGAKLARDKAIADKISQITGYELLGGPGGIPNIAFGYSQDWFNTYFDKPSLTLEIGSPYSTHPLKISQFNNIFSRNKDVPLAFTQLVQ